LPPLVHAPHTPQARVRRRLVFLRSEGLDAILTHQTTYTPPREQAA
jgi:hypothetical protein